MKNKLYKSLMHKPNAPVNNAKHKRYRNILNKTIVKAKQNYYHEQITKNNNDISRLWKLINELITLKANNQKSIKQLKTETGAMVTELLTISLRLNEYFANI